jgi:hypothetical protein
MERELTTGDRSVIQEQLKILATTLKSLVTKLAVGLSLYIIISLLVFDPTIVATLTPFVLVIAAFVIYQSNLRWTYDLRRDLEKGVKNIDEAIVARIRKKDSRVKWK